MISLLRYQWAILFRSHRWIFPLLVYVVLLATGAAQGSTPLAEGLEWSAAVLVPAVAILTRSMLIAEPDASRACVAAAADPVRAQLATLLTALSGGAVLAIGGAMFEVVSTAPGHGGTLASVLLPGLAVAAVCLLAGSAAGALCNPPLLRHTGLAIMSTIAAVVFALASGISPANAALRTSGHVAQWPSLTSLVVAAVLLVVTWTASVLAAAYRA